MRTRKSPLLNRWQFTWPLSTITIVYYRWINRTMPLLCKISKEPILHFLGLVKYSTHYTDDVKKVNDIRNNKWIDYFLFDVIGQKSSPLLYAWKYSTPYTALLASEVYSKSSDPCTKVCFSQSLFSCRVGKAPYYSVLY